MSTLAVLTTTFTANTKPFTSGVTRAGASVKTLEQRVKTSSGGLGRWARNMAAGAVASLGLYAAINQLRQAFSEMDALAKTASQLGMTPEALIELQFIAERTGFGVDQLSVAIEKMSVRISETVAGTGEARAAFAQLGLSAEGLMAMSPEAAFRKISVALAGIKSPADQARIAYKLFEEAGGKMLNMLRLTESEFQGLREELRQLAPQLASINFENAEEMQDALTRVKYRFKILRMFLAIELMPVLEKVVAWVMKIFDWFNKWGTQIKIMLSMLGAFVKYLWEWRKVLLALVVAYVAMRTATAAYNAVRAIQLGLMGPRGWAILAMGAAASAAALYGMYKASQLVSRQLKRQKGDIDNLTNSTKKGRDGYKDMSKELAAAARVSELMKKGEQLTKTLRTPVQVFGDTLGELEEMINAGAISWETYQRAIAKANETLFKSLDTQKKLNRAREKGFGAVTRGTVAAFSASQSSNREFRRLELLQQDENRMAAERNRILNDIKKKALQPAPVAGI